MSPSEVAQACGRGLVPISDEPSRSLHSTLMAPPWAAPRARAAIDSGGGASFRSLPAPRAGRIAHLATRNPDQDGSPAAIGRFSRATDENGCADRLHNAALLRRLCKLTTTKTSFAGSAVRVILHHAERPERPNAERPYRHPIGQKSESRPRRKRGVRDSSRP